MRRGEEQAVPERTVSSEPHPLSICRLWRINERNGAAVRRMQ